ncbi:tumor necrosis factor alpha-induced protein 2-like isoform X2 [Engraulis encrasicolus]|uniref:tumor necrosis factor alpha-induced protein 2-like isoform X2 n=1 Tax=Engraulis encrasicolus TaxID=184585 RepID=UPI002FD1A867
MRALKSPNAVSPKVVSQALQAARAKISNPFSKVGNPLGKFMPSVPSAFRRNSKTPSVGTADTPESPDASCAEGLVVTPPTFQEWLSRRSFSEASRLLIGREERLYGRGQHKEDGLQENQEEELEEEAGLRQDYETLLEEIKKVIGSSLFVTNQSEKDALTEAVLAMQQEEEQDLRWAGPSWQNATGCPDWRPLRVRHAHDTLLEEIVKRRVQEVGLCEGGGSSIQRDLLGLGRRIRTDLLQVCREVRGCYPGDMGVVRMYACLYHQAFSAHLRSLTEFTLDHQDNTHLLSWVLRHYPSILQEEELASELDADCLEPLLPADVIGALVEQYTQEREAMLQSCLERILKREEQSWRAGTTEIIDGCHFSPLAIDTIQFVDDTLKSAQVVLGEKTQMHRLLSLLPAFLTRYQEVMEGVMRQEAAQRRAVVMANLSCLRMFSEYLTAEKSLPEDVRSNCVALVTSMIDSCHSHLTDSIQLSLKETYRKLWVPSWLQKSERVRQQLTDQLHTHLLPLQAVEQTSRQALLSHLHECVCVSYVRRMLKKKCRLKDRKQQEAAADACCLDNKTLHTLFTQAGCDLGWRNDILPALGELLRLQDPSSISLELLTTTTKLPDMSMEHLSALLHLKSNLSEKDIKNIKRTFAELMEAHTAHTHTPTRVFFSKVDLKK